MIAVTAITFSCLFFHTLHLRLQLRALVGQFAHSLLPLHTFMRCRATHITTAFAPRPSHTVCLRQPFATYIRQRTALCTPACNHALPAARAHLPAPTPAIAPAWAYRYCSLSPDCDVYGVVPLDAPLVCTPILRRRLPGAAAHTTSPTRHLLYHLQRSVVTFGYYSCRSSGLPAVFLVR